MQSNRRITKDTECKAVLSRNINDGRIQQDWHGGYGKAERERESERKEKGPWKRKELVLVLVLVLVSERGQ